MEVGVNSYISVEDANEYFDGRLFADAWAAAEVSTKEKALRMATQKIERLPVRGIKAYGDQMLQFPRAFMYHGVYKMETEISDAVKAACCEEALAILKHGAKANQRSELQAQGVKSFRIGNLSESFGGTAAGTRLLSVEAKDLLAGYTGGYRLA